MPETSTKKRKRKRPDDKIHIRNIFNILGTRQGKTVTPERLKKNEASLELAWLAALSSSGETGGLLERLGVQGGPWD